MFVSTAIYQNRIEDKIELENKLSLSEEGNDTKFYLPDGTIFAIGYNRIVYGDHGPYLEFARQHILCKMYSKYGNLVDYNNLPDLNYKYFYFWLYPEENENIKIYLQIKPVTNLSNAPKREDKKPSAFNRMEGYADYKRGMFYVDPYSLYAEDPRKIGLKHGLRQLNKEQLERVINYPNKMVLDSYNYQDGCFCPLAVALKLDELIVEPTHDKVYNELIKLGYKVYNTRGIKGKFYTINRKEDLLEAAREVLQEKYAK